MANVKIQAFDNGPFKLNGEVDIVDGQGSQMETKQECYLCRCGLSGNQPYCSGAHEGKYHNKVRAK
jgi:CDGSH-type Zn-finger protein